MSNDAKHLAEARAVISTLIETLQEEGLFGIDAVTDALDFLRHSTKPLHFEYMSRAKLIEQLRHATYLAESPAHEVVEFELGNTDFSFDYTD